MYVKQSRIKNAFLSNPAPGESLESGNLVMETGCIIVYHGMSRYIMSYQFIAYHSIVIDNNNNVNIDNIIITTIMIVVIVISISVIMLLYLRLVLAVANQEHDFRPPLARQ